MTLQQISYILTIAKTGSMNKAAEALFVSQPSLTSAVRELEGELGITVFQRTSKGTIPTNIKRKFGVSSQHYSFAVRAFVETVKHFDTLTYDFAMRETKTLEVIQDVAALKSMIGILYMNDFNRKVIVKILRDNDLEFHHLIDCSAYVYLWKNHPLAKEKFITFPQLMDYPCLSFEQGESGSFYFAEEILSTGEYKRTIKATDRATMLNLMVGLNGYTLCSGIICEDLNGSDYVAVPFKDEEENPGSKMEIGYIIRKNAVLGEIGETYIAEMKKYLNEL